MIQEFLTLTARIFGVLVAFCAFVAAFAYTVYWLVSWDNTLGAILALLYMLLVGAAWIAAACIAAASTL